MRTDSLPRLILVGLATLAVVACAATGGDPRATSAGDGGSSPAGPRETGAAATSSSPRAAAGVLPEAWLLVERRGQTNLSLVLASDGTPTMDMPTGAPRSSAAWDRMLIAMPDGASTVVSETGVDTGPGTPGLRIDGHWRLPTVGLDPIPAGRSLDGSTAVLVEGVYDPMAGRSRFAVVEHSSGGLPSADLDAPLRLVRIIELPGAFEYDTLSPDGRIVYVVQHLDGEAGGHYQVRAVDVATGTMRDGVIVDKTHPDETMAGAPVAQVRRPGGVVLTLYRGPEHPFIHALNSSEAWAVCIDLPNAAAGGASGASGDADVASLDWGLAPSPDGASVYAVNASIGLIVEVDPSQFAVRRSATIATTASVSIAFAKFGHGDVGPVGRRLVVGPDGRTLFAGGQDGVTVVRTADLSVVRHDVAGSPVVGLGLTPDGTVLYALLAGGSIVALDTHDGRDLGTVPGSYDRLLAVAPW